MNKRQIHWSDFSLTLLTLSSSSCCLLFSSTAALRSSSFCLCSSSRLQRSSTVRSYCSRALRSFSRISCSLAAEKKQKTSCYISSYIKEKSNEWNKYSIRLHYWRFTVEMLENIFWSNFVATLCTCNISFRDAGYQVKSFWRGTNSKALLRPSG